MLAKLFQAFLSSSNLQLNFSNHPPSLPPSPFSASPHINKASICTKEERVVQRSGQKNHHLKHNAITDHAHIHESSRVVDRPNGHSQRDEGEEEGEEEGVCDAAGFRVPNFLPLHGTDVDV